MPTNREFIEALKATCDAWGHKDDWGVFVVTVETLIEKLSTRFPAEPDAAREDDGHDTTCRRCGVSINDTCRECGDIMRERAESDRVEKDHEKDILEGSVEKASIGSRYWPDMHFNNVLYIWTTLLDGKPGWRRVNERAKDE